MAEAEWNSPSAKARAPFPDAHCAVPTFYQQVLRQQDEGKVAFKKYLFALPSNKMAETFTVCVQADIPQDSAVTILVPLGNTAKLASAPTGGWPVKSMITLDNSLVDGKVSFNFELPLRQF